MRILCVTCNHAVMQCLQPLSASSCKSSRASLNQQNGCCPQGFLQVDLSDDEIGMIVDTLVFDTLVDRIPQASDLQ